VTWGRLAQFNPSSLTPALSRWERENVRPQRGWVERSRPLDV